MSSLTFKNFSIYYKQRKDIITAVDDVSFSFHSEKINVLIGLSGCGKTSILNAISGAILFDGELLLNGEDIRQIQVQKRNLSYVNQQFILYPHLTIYDNIAYPLKLLKLPRDEIDNRVKEIAKEVDVYYLLTRKPKYLSIGQQQRVAIARAFVKRPDIILMDEPLSNVDKETANEIRLLIKDLIKQYQATCIYVSHNITEALSIADYVYVMDEGKIIGEYTPTEFLETNNEIVNALRVNLPK